MSTKMPLKMIVATALFAVGSLFCLAISSLAAKAQDLSLLPGDAVIAPAAGDQTAPAIAQGGNIQLAVWTDNRPNPSPFGILAGSEYETSRDIYGVRIDAAGNILDAVPFAIVSGRANQDYPRVSWNGTNWLVVYQSVDIGGTGAYQNSIEAVRVSPAGQVLDAKPIKLYGLTSVHGNGSVASDGNNWVIVTQGTSTGNDIVAVRISAGGSVLDPPTRVLLSATEGPRFGGLLAYAGGVFVFNYGDSNNIPKLGRFDSSLTNLGPATLPSEVQLGALTNNGTGFYAVWNRQEISGLVHVVGSRINTAGTILDGTGSNISGTKEPSAYATTAVVWDGVNWRVTWGELNTSYTARINTSGVVLDPGSVAVANVQTGPTAGNGAGSVQMMWTEFVNNNNDVVTANISPSHVAGPKRTTSVGAPQQTLPDIATSGNGCMLVYRSATSTQGRVLAQPLDSAGNPLTTEPVEMDSGININGPGNPNVAWNGTLYLVTWRTPTGIVGQRLSTTGAKLDAAPFMVISGGFGSADVAALGSNFLVTGQKVGISIQYIGPVAARVSGSGVVLDASPLFLGISYVGRAPAVVELGGRWFAAWHRNATHDNSSCYSIGAFIDAAGAVTPEFQIHGPFSTAGGNGIFEVGLASNGTKAFFVQSQELTSGVETDLLGLFIDANGTVSPDFNLTPWEGNQYKPRAAWDGSNFIITYQDQKNRITEQAQDPLDARSDLFGMRVTPAGTIVDPQGFLFSALPISETDPNLASLNGVTLFAGSVMKNDAAFANYRVVYEQRNAAANKWPVAVAVATPAGGNVPLTVNFSSVGSGDPDGTIAGYLWDFGDGTTTTAASPAHTYTVPGPFVAMLTVTDDGGAQTKQTVLVKADAPNALPIAVASGVPIGDPLSLNVNFYADGSYDPDGFLGNIQWDYSDGGTDFGSPAYHSFASAGTYTATLTVYDRLGATGTTDLTIHVGTGGPSPSATSTPTSTATLTPTATPTGSLLITGTVTYGNAIGSPTPRFVSNVTITANGSPTIITTTGAPGPTAGQYSLTGFGASSYTVTPTKTGGVNGSITSFDAAKIAQHAAGVPPGLNATQLIVADVSGNGTVTSFDAAQVARYAASISGSGATGSWIFRPVNTTYPEVTANITGQDYTALLMGEVSGNWTNTGARPASGFNPNALAWLIGGGF